MSSAAAEFTPTQPNAYRQTALELYDSLESLYGYVGTIYPMAVVAPGFSPHRHDGGVYEASEANADRFTRDNVTVVAHPKCRVRAVLEQTEQDATAYTLYVAETLIDHDSYPAAYQDLALRSFTVRGSEDLLNTLTLVQVLAVNDPRRPASLLPEGFTSLERSESGRIALGDARAYETAVTEERAGFDSSIRLAESMIRGIDKIGLSRRQFREKYGQWHGSGHALQRLARTAVSGAANLWPSLRRGRSS